MFDVPKFPVGVGQRGGFFRGMRERAASVKIYPFLCAHARPDHCVSGYAVGGNRAAVFSLYHRRARRYAKNLILLQDETDSRILTVIEPVKYVVGFHSLPHQSAAETTGNT